MSLKNTLKIVFLASCLICLAACKATSSNNLPLHSSNLELQEPDTLKRSFVDGLYGQVHVRISTPPSGVVQKKPLLLLHPTPYSSQFFLPFIGDIGNDRVVIAIDTPGYGDSDRPEDPPSMQEYAQNAIKVLDALKITDPIDAIGYHTGTLIAVEMSILEPNRISKMILAGIPVYPPQRLPGLYEKYAKPDEIKKDGSHLTSKWNFAIQTVDAGMSLEKAQSHYADYMQALPESTQAYYSVFSYPGYERLPLIQRPSLFVSINGSLKEETREAQKITPGSDLIYLDHVTTGLFDVTYPEMAQIARNYLD